MTGTYDVVPVACALPAQRSLRENKLGLTYDFFWFNFLNFIAF